jgi:hypothetical protein
MVQARLSVSDPAEFASARDWLGRVPGIDVRQLPSVPAPGEQGAGDLLMIVAESTGVLTVAVRSLPEFIRSRRSNVTVTVTTADKKFELTTTNVAEVMPLLEKALGNPGDTGDRG